MLRGYNVFEVIPFCDNNLSELAKVNEAKQISFLSFQPCISMSDFSSAFSEFFDFRWELVLPICSLFFFERLTNEITYFVFEAK